MHLDEGPRREPVYPNWNDGFEGCWTWGKQKAQAELNFLVAREVSGSYKIFRKAYAKGQDGNATKQVKSIWTDKEY